MNWFVGALVVLMVFLVAGYLVKMRKSKKPTQRLQLTGLLHININCSDFERSRAFYEMLGFQVLMKVEPVGMGDVAASVGMDSYRVRGALMAHKDGSVIDLLEWEEPRDTQPPYEKLNRLGLGRIAFITNDIESDIAHLKAEGVTFVSTKPGEVKDPFGGTTRFICFKDPDGTVLELVQMGTVMGLLSRASKLSQKSSLASKAPEDEL